MIYLDNAATTLHKPPEVAEAVLRAMGTMGNGGRGVHGGALTAARTVYGARAALADFFGCGDPSRVCFTANSTEALNIALFGLLSPGDHVITTDLEHNSVLRPLYRLERTGVRLTILPADRQGNIAYEAMEAAIGPDTRLIACTHASNLTGNLLDLRRIGGIAQRHGLLLVVDASQTAGSFPIDMGDLGISVLCFTGHKGMMGPQGTGGLCVAEGVEIQPLLYGGTGVQSHEQGQPMDYPTRLEAGTLNGHGIAGLAAAVAFLNRTGMETIHRWELGLMTRFYEGVLDLPGVTVYGDFSGDRAPIVALNLEGMDSSGAADLLDQDYGIAVRAGAHCAPRMHAALGTTEQGAVRFSFGWYNTEAEVDAAVEAGRALARETA